MQTRDINIKLLNKDVSIIKDVLNLTRELPSLSANELLSKLQNGTLNPKFYDAIFSSLADLEGISDQTYPDSKQHMTIGVGLDISNPKTKAVLLSVNSSWDFDDMQAHKERPIPPLTREEIKKVLLFTLIGCNRDGLEFIGEVPNLISHLESISKLLNYNPKLSDIPFKPHELICLVSMAFNNPSLIGKNFCKSLYEYYQTKDPMPVLLQITECSNKLYNESGVIRDCTGLQHRRMKEAAIFIGDPENIHLSYRQFKRIETALSSIDITLIPKNGLPIYAQPYKEKERTSSSEETIRKIETINDEYGAPFATYYGSKNGSEINVTENDVHPIVICGDGDNVVNVSAKNYGESYPYLVGGTGNNKFNISSQAGNVMIWPRGNSEITLDGKYDVHGVALKTKNENEYHLESNDKLFTLTRKKQDENSEKLYINWGDDKNDITIPNFESGQFNLILGSETLDISMSNMMAPKQLANGKFVSFYLRDNRVLMVRIIDQSGKFHDYELASVPENSDKIQFWIFGLDIKVIDNNFMIAWHEYSRKIIIDENIPGHDTIITTTSITVAVCSESGPVSFFPLKQPNGSAICQIFEESWSDRPKKIYGSSFDTYASVYKTSKDLVVFYKIIDYLGVDQTFIRLLFSSPGGQVKQLMEGIQSYYVPTGSVLKNGNFIFGVDNETNETMIYTLSPGGVILNKYPSSLVLCISPVAEGFMFVSAKNDNYYTHIFNGESWGLELKLPWEHHYYFSSCSLKNDYTLLAWNSYNHQSKSFQIEIMIIDSNNNPISNPIFLKSGTGYKIDIKMIDGLVSITLFDDTSMINYRLDISYLPTIELIQNQDLKDNIVVKPSEQSYFGRLYNFFVPPEKRVELPPKSTDDLMNEFTIIDKSDDKTECRNSLIGFNR